MAGTSLLRGITIFLRFSFLRLRNPLTGRHLYWRYMDKSSSNGHGALTNAPQPPEQQPEKPSRLLVLVRHGQSTYNVEGRLPGQIEGIALTDEGRRQAHRAAVALSALPIDTVVTSPLERARETAEIIARGWSLPVCVEPRLKDTDVGAWAGAKISDLSKSDPAWRAFVANPTQPPDGIEGFHAVQSRSVAAVEDLLRSNDAGRHIVVVAHADVIKLILAHYTQVPAESARFISVANASISALAFRDGEHPYVLSMNWTPAPDWLVPPTPKPAHPEAATLPAAQAEPQAPAPAAQES